MKQGQHLTQHRTGQHDWCFPFVEHAVGAVVLEPTDTPFHTTFSNLQPCLNVMKTSINRLCLYLMLSPSCVVQISTIVYLCFLMNAHDLYIVFFLFKTIKCKLLLLLWQRNYLTFLPILSTDFRNCPSVSEASGLRPQGNGAIVPSPGHNEELFHII